MKNVGVWIDHQKAVLVTMDPLGERTETISSEHEAGAGSGQSSSYTRNDFTADDRLQRRETHHLNRFYDQVIEAMTGCDSVLVLGPGEAKQEFTKRLENLKTHHEITIEMETADKMTEHQLVAHVKQKFLAAVKP